MARHTVIFVQNALVLALRLFVRLAGIIVIAYLIFDLIDAVLDAGHLGSCL